MNPFKSLLRSRKFWLLIFDMIVSTILLAFSQYWPQHKELAVQIIGIYQLPIVFVIGSLAYEDGKAKAAGTFQPYLDAQKKIAEG